MTDPATVVWTDGSSTGGWGPGGWAWCVLEGPNANRWGSGGHVHTTNQRMELTAAHEAVKALAGPILIRSDSAYVVNCFLQRWWVNWRAKDFRKVKNDTLWRPFIDDVLARGDDVQFEWVKGHVGYEGNELADKLAKEAKLEFQDLLDHPPCSLDSELAVPA